MSERAKVSVKKPKTKRENSFSKTRNIDSSQSKSSPVEQILHFQRTIGNQAVLRLFKSGVIQAKLRIGNPNGIYEQEADRVADQIMRMPESQLQRQPEEEEKEEELIQTKLLTEPMASLVQRQVEEEEEEKEILQTKGHTGQTLWLSRGLEAQIHSMRGSGQPLPKSVQNLFEPRFGRDFSQVRIHTDTQAAYLAGTMNARAFTVGQDIAFGVGQYSPGTTEGINLLAHELTHVVQQKITKTSTTSGPTEIHRYEPKPQRAPSPKLRWDFYPGTSRDVVEQQMRYVAEGRKAEEITQEIRPIESFEDIFAELGGYAHFWKERHNVPSISPFVREIHILGHGHKLPGEGMRIGAKMYSEADLEKFSTGWGQRFMQPNARIVLEGCSIAGGYSGRKFIYEVARVFFGEKVGYIRASTCIGFLVYKETKKGTRPELTECSPIDCKYPDDFREGGRCSLEEF